MTLQHPLAVAMWDFSWLERRWPGAGYEDWNQALDELIERGYDAVRIDAYPHFHYHADPDQPRTVLPCWNQNDWGTPAPVTVQVEPALCDFIRRCAERGLRVGLSSWYQRDPDDLRMRATAATEHGRQWLSVLRRLDDADLLHVIHWVDLCNEWPIDAWAPFYPPHTRTRTEAREPRWSDADSLAWMREAIDPLRAAYPDLRYTFSDVFTTHHHDQTPDDLAHLDLLEPHLWMAQAEDSAFYQQVGYHYQRWESTGYDNLVRYGEPLYRRDPERWQAGLRDLIDRAADWSRRVDKPLITTEGWGVVDYKDWPGLNWDWVKQITAVGVEHAAATGRWEAICTSNFCGPQFVGMWRDLDWHRQLTDRIHAAPLPAPTTAPA